MSRLLASLVCGWLVVAPALTAPQLPKEDGVAELLRRIEQALQSGDPSAYLQLLSAAADRERARIFAASVTGSGVTTNHHHPSAG